jgi:NAD-dependent deacetylase
MNNLVVLSGAGMSAESGIKTFRDNDGLWEEFDVYDVATPEAWDRNPELVLRFYNERRKQLYSVSPNAGHLVLNELEKYFNVDIITQNVDDLHERAGSSRVLHLHGELKKVRSTVNPEYIILIGRNNLTIGDKCPLGGQLRPHIVWFGEDVPLIEPAAEIVSQADVLLIVGTSLNVYPAAGLINYASKNTPIYIIDPKDVSSHMSRIIHTKNTAAKGLPILAKELIKLYA